MFPGVIYLKISARSFKVSIFKSLCKLNELSNLKQVTIFFGLTENALSIKACIFKFGIWRPLICLASTGRINHTIFLTTSTLNSTSRTFMKSGGTIQPKL